MAARAWAAARVTSWLSVWDSLSWRRWSRPPRRGTDRCAPSRAPSWQGFSRDSQPWRCLALSPLVLALLPSPPFEVPPSPLADSGRTDDQPRRQCVHGGERKAHRNGNSGNMGYMIS
eukprot:4891435-Prymnesium_polylepis.1